MSEIDNIIVLTGEDGVEARYEFLDLVVYKGNKYVVLLSADDPEDNEAIILQVLPGPDAEHENYVSVVDIDTIEAVFQLFKEQNADEYDFND